jgi:hypothetical protein
MLGTARDDAMSRRDRYGKAGEEPTATTELVLVNLGDAPTGTADPPPARILQVSIVVR